VETREGVAIVDNMLSTGARRVLAALQQMPPDKVANVTNANLADHLNISPFTVSRAISELQRAEHITCGWHQPDPGKGRWSGRSITLNSR
jgi:DNA-binding MarR family transcriptional regulator